MGRKNKLKKRNPKGNGNLSLSVFFQKNESEGGTGLKGLEAKTTGENMSTKKPTPPPRRDSLVSPTYVHRITATTGKQVIVATLIEKKAMLGSL